MKKRYIFTAALAIWSVLPPQTVHASTVPSQPVLIAAIQTGQEGAAGNDFVVLHNTTEEPVDVTGWKLQYRAASATGAAAWATKRTIACVPEVSDCLVSVPSRSNMLLATYDIAGMERQPFTTGFSSLGGQLRLVRPAQGDLPLDVIDLVGYGSAAVSEGAPAPAPAANNVLVRRHTVHMDLVDTNANDTDFTVGCYTPSASGVPVAVSCEAPPADEPEEDPPVEEPVPASPSTPNPAMPVYAHLTITELLPDPASPATDSADEFIELYNPNRHEAAIAGYTLQTGPDFRYQYSLGDIVVPAGGYAAIYSAESRLSLTNSGTSVRLVDPNGVVLDTVASYGQAKSGQSWAKSASGWQWTLTPTPGAPNSMNAPVPKAVLAAATAAKKATAKKATAAKAKTTKAPAAKAAKTAAATPVAAQLASTKPQESGTIQYWVLGGVGALIVAYALYEYRQDIARLGRRLKARLTGGKKPAQEPAATQQTD